MKTKSFARAAGIALLIAGGAAVAPGQEVEKAALMRYFTRADIQKRLTELARSPKPANLRESAPLGEMKLNANRVEYLCPVCRTVTPYIRERTPPPRKRRDDSWSWTPAADSGKSFLRQKQDQESMEDGGAWLIGNMIEFEIPQCRQLIRTITRLRLKLDESRLCRKCSPNVKEPQLGLLIVFGAEKAGRRVWGVKSNELRLISEFLLGKKVHVSADGGESALKDHLGRLEEIFGLKAARL